MKNSDREIPNRLIEELNRATSDYMKLQREEAEITKDVPTGIPLSDGLARLVGAGTLSRAAFEKYRKAVKRYRDFVEHGIIPDDYNHK